MEPLSTLVFTLDHDWIFVQNSISANAILFWIVDVDQLCGKLAWKKGFCSFIILFLRFGLLFNNGCHRIVAILRVKVTSFAFLFPFHAESILCYQSHLFIVVKWILFTFSFHGRNLIVFILIISTFWCLLNFLILFRFEQFK